MVLMDQSVIRVPVDVSSNFGPIPQFEYPQGIGEYTVTRERRLVPGREDAKYLYEAALADGGLVNFDLNRGYSTFEHKVYDDKMDLLLEWIISQAPCSGPLKKVLREADFVCRRGVLIRIGSTPYYRDDTWEFVAARINGVIFLCERETELYRQRFDGMTNREKLMTYWGYKFEQYMTVAEKDDQKLTLLCCHAATFLRGYRLIRAMIYPSYVLDKNVKLFLSLYEPAVRRTLCYMRIVTEQLAPHEGKPNVNIPLTRAEEFGVVVCSELTKSPERPLQLVIAGEVDAINRYGRLVELKTQRKSLDRNFWKNKSVKWWLQSFLLGICEIIVGYRNDDGFIKKVESVQTGELAAKAKWSGDVCLNLIYNVLREVNAMLVDGGACIVHYEQNSRAIEIRSAPLREINFFTRTFRAHFGIEYM